MHVQAGGGAFRFTHVWAGHLLMSFREKEKDSVFTPEHILRRSVPKLPQESVQNKKTCILLAKSKVSTVSAVYSAVLPPTLMVFLIFEEQISANKQTNICGATSISDGIFNI